MARKDEFDKRALELTVAAIAAGGMGTGNPVDSISTCFHDVATALKEIDVEAGSEPMNAAADLAIAAMQAGLIYAGEETLDFLRRTAERVRVTSRELNVTSRFT